MDLITATLIAFIVVFLAVWTYLTISGYKLWVYLHKRWTKTYTSTSTQTYPRAQPLRETRGVITQSQTTYKYKNSKPEFKVCTKAEQEVFTLP